MTIGNRIKDRRKELGMTQGELASKMGYKDNSAIARIESGENDIPQSKVTKFAEVLNTTESALMGWDEEEKLDKEQKTLFEDYNSLTEEEKKLVAGIIKGLKNGTFRK